MLINKKLITSLSLASVVTLVALTSMAPEKEGFKNLKVLPKNITHEQLHKVMDEWANSLNVHCSFCHVRNEETKKTDFVSDAKPAKEMAREMYKMMNKINQKYFEAKKDTLGMMKESGINCYTCHRGESHPEVKIPEEPKRGPGGPPPGSAAPATPPKQ